VVFAKQPPKSSRKVVKKEKMIGGAPEMGRRERIGDGENGRWGAESGILRFWILDCGMRNSKELG
jgi:hypothetical protein